ncbi:MAG TPA: carboxypeptidase regulatory-like domain-containing protein, partial [Burkholderiaceae bacterium]
MTVSFASDSLAVRRGATALALAAAALLAACGGGGGGASSDGHSSGAGAGNGNGNAPPTNTFAGTITFQGAPLAGVTVVAFNTNTNTTFATTTTDAAGRYSFSGLGTGCNCTLNYQFWARKTGFSFAPAIGGDPDVDHTGYQWQGTDWHAPAGGTSISREDYTGQFSNPGGGSAFIQTVLDFDSLANGSVSD